MSLADAFARSKNLKGLTSSWIKHVSARMREEQIQSSVRLNVDNAASMVAPAALVATMIERTGLLSLGRPLRVLILGTDPMTRLDRSAWVSFAGDMLGAPGRVEIVLCSEEEALTSFYPVAEALGMPTCTCVTHAAVRSSGGESIDMALWIHPATEASEPTEMEMVTTALSLVSGSSVPVYTACFNVADLHAQNYLLHGRSLRLTPLGGDLKRGSDSINRFGISTKGVGVEGGWGAVLARLEPMPPSLAAEDLALVSTALRLRCIEGALHSSWHLGQRINGVAFNRILPIGLLGNMALDTASGHILSEDYETRELRLVGQLWRQKLDTLPAGDSEVLMLWASEVMLSFLWELPKEDHKRREAIELLERALDDGVLAAGIGLARCFEGSESTVAKATELYRRIGERHPFSAYYLAHEAIDGGDVGEGERLLRVSAAFGYPIAQTDLAKLIFDTASRKPEALAHLRSASAAGDIEASFSLGELYTEAYEFDAALAELRKAWSYGHAEAAALAARVAEHMLDIKMGKRSVAKRELREAQECLRKLHRRAKAAAVRAGAHDGLDRSPV